MTAKDGKPCKKCGTRKWYASGKCKECHRERAHQWARANPEKMIEASRRYRQANHERESESSRRWKRDNPHKHNAINQRRRTRKAQSGGCYTGDEFKTVCAHYGNKCLRCGRDDVKLTADHIKPISKGGSSNIENIQPLCFSCNAAKKDRHIDYRPDAGPLRWLQCKLFG